MKKHKTFTKYLDLKVITYTILPYFSIVNIIKNKLPLLGAGIIGTFLLCNFLPTANAGNEGKAVGKIKATPYTASIGGCTKNAGGTISKADFLTLIKSPFCGLHTVTNINYPVAAFDILYCEKEVSEDSTGHPIVVTDCLGDAVVGDHMPDRWVKVFTDRLYKGDSIRFDNILIKNGANNFRSKNSIVVVIKD